MDKAQNGQHKNQRNRLLVLRCFPVIDNLFIDGEIYGVYGYTGSGLGRVYDKLRIGCPSKIMYVFGFEMPGGFSFRRADLSVLIVAFYLVGVLKYAGTTHDIVFRKMEGNIEVAKGGNELARDVLVQVPAEF